MEGNVYFILSAEPKAIKIGFTAGHPRKRLKQLQTGNPTELILLGWFAADLETERSLHAELADYRLTGEWFRVCEGISPVLEAPFRMMQINNKLSGHIPS